MVLHYPFKAIEDDSTQVFTQEYMVKLHRILQYRYDHQMQMPNFILWCNQTPVNEGLQIFAINEIRLFRLTEDCAELLTMLCNSHDVYGKRLSLQKSVTLCSELVCSGPMQAMSRARKSFTSSGMKDPP